MSRYMAGRSLVAALYAAVDRADLASIEWWRITSLIMENGGVGGDKQ